MNHRDIHLLYSRLQKELGEKYMGKPLSYFGWTFEITNAKTQIGICRLHKRRIGFSRHFISLPDDMIEDTLRHEIAHALDFYDRGTSDHSAAWKLWARRCGADPSRLTEVPPEALPKAKYTLRCRTCGAEARRYRLTRRRAACASCCNRYSGGKFDPAYVLEIIQNY